MNMLRDYFETGLSLMDRGMLNAMGRLGRMMADVPVDIVEHDDKYVIKATIAGYKKEEIEINYKDDILTISGTHETKENSENAENGKYIVKERGRSSFVRTFSVVGIKEDGISAKMTDGILTVVLPKEKVEEVPPKKINIE